MTNLIVTCRMGHHEAKARWKDRVFDVVIGRSGPVAAADKREGDGATPLGTWPMLMGFYRADRGPIPGGNAEAPKFPWWNVVKGSGFCDMPDDPLYNQLVPAGHPSSGGLWQKESSRHDVSVFLGYNVAPIVPDKGSAVMLHGKDKPMTAACIGMDAADLRSIAEEFVYGDAVEIVLASEVQDD